MVTFNAGNERIKRRYVHYMKEARGLSDTTMRQALYAIAAFERWTQFREFKHFRSEHAVGFKKHLLAGSGKRAAELSRRATVHSTLMSLRVFFRWLAVEPGFRKSLDARDADFFNLSAREARVATTRFEKPIPSLEQVQTVIRAMPSGTDVEKRNRALVALVLLTGVRVKALTTLKLRHVRRDGTGIDQDAREVETKRAKTFSTHFFQVGDDVREIFQAYVHHLRTTLKFGGSDPLFPSTRQDVDHEHQFKITGLTRSHWKTADPVRDIFQAAYERAGVPYFTPHTVRSTLARLGEQLCRTPEEMKAWSQNLGHDEVLTTFTSYGSVPAIRQAQIISGLRQPPVVEDSALREAIRLISQRFDCGLPG